MTASAYRGLLACPRCHARVEEHEAYAGCPRCWSEGLSVNVHPVYDLEDWRSGAGEAGPAVPQVDAPGIFRWAPLLPLGAGTRPVSLAEGGTPLLPVPRLAARVGVDALYVKDESRNPTWSYKDRLAAVAVTKAVEVGADTVVVSTTGNHGAAAAAYAAAAGLRCVVLTLASVPLTMKVLMQSYGASVVALGESRQRWAVMEQAVTERGWIPLSGFRDPPAGSNPFGVDAYKTLAYELHEDLDGAVPDVVVVPTAYADGLTGIARGFQDLLRLGVAARLPRMVAAEPLGPYAASLEAGGDQGVTVQARSSVAFSTASPVATYQGVSALRSTDGLAAAADDATIMAAQREVAQLEGLYMEAASAASIPVLAGLVANGRVPRDSRVVVVGTSTGLKDVGASAAELPAVPVIEPTLAALDEALAVPETSAAARLQSAGGPRP